MMMTATPSVSVTQSVLLDLYPQFLAALLAGDHRRCGELVDQALAMGVPILVIYQQIFQQALYQVGEEWAQNRISVGVEHLATAIVEGLLNRLYSRLITPHQNGRRIIIGSVEGELHQIGAKMVCDVFEMHGWEALYLGADTPTAELLRTVRDLRPDAVGLSLSVYSHLGRLLDAVELIRSGFPDLPVLIGGQGLRRVGANPIHDPKVHYASDLDTLECLISSLSETAAQETPP